MTKYNRLHRAVRRLNDYEVPSARHGSGRSPWPAHHQGSNGGLRLQTIVEGEPRLKSTRRPGA